MDEWVEAGSGSSGRGATAERCRWRSSSRGSGAVLGSCDLRSPEPDDPGRGEIGYLLLPEAQGAGRRRAPCGCSSAGRFRELGMRRVQALVHPDNAASAAVLERLGFEREGLLRSYRPGGEDRVMFAVFSSPAS